MWHVTDRCPLRCPYCFASKTELETDVTKLKRIIAIFKALGVQKVDIAGGEPLVWADLPHAAEALADGGFALTLTTSGVGTEANRRWIVERARLFTRIIVSIDAPTEAEHDALRKFPGAFAAARTLVEHLHKSEYVHVRVNTVLVRPMNDEGNLRRLALTIAAMRPQEWCIIQPHPANQKPDFKLFALNSPAFVDAAATLVAIAHSDKLTIGRIISRTADDYAGYWVLYPDGFLKRHTTGPNDCAEMPILETSLGPMIATIQRYGYTLPMRSL